ncbi:MAG: aminotransferase class V-fold PLP-dependent enzyme [Pseudomonadota bacterium]
MSAVLSGSHAASFDLEQVRAWFPAFQEPSLAGWAHFENAGGSYPCLPVIDRLSEFYRSTKVQPHAPYPASRRAGERMDETPQRLAPWLGVRPQDVHLGPSTSQNTYVLAHAFRAGWREGDAVIVTNQDHEANSGPWRRLERAGIEVREWRMTPEGRLDPADLANLLDGRVRLAAFPHCSNLLGEINPVADICALLREAGVISVVDGVSYAPHGLPDVGALGADIYLFSTYKTFGPHQGAIVARAELAMELENQGHFFNADQPTKRLVPAGPDHAQVAAAAGIADYLEALDALHHPGADPAPGVRRARVADLIRAREAELLASLLDALRDLPGLRLLGPDDPQARAPTVSLALDHPGEAAAARLAEFGLMAGGGHFYAWRPLEALGLDPEHGVLRLSFLHYTSPEEIARAAEGLESLARGS